MLEQVGKWLLTAVAGLLLCAMTVLTVVDVVGRKYFTAPVPGAFEATEVMLALAIFAGLPIVTARSEHISVRLFVDLLPPLVQRILSFVCDLLVAFLLGFGAYLLYGRGDTLAQFGDATILLGIPLAPVAFALAALSALAALVAFFKLFRRSRPAEGEDR